jgi:hypothetical protein
MKHADFNGFFFEFMLEILEKQARNPRQSARIRVIRVPIRSPPFLSCTKKKIIF